MLCMGIAQTDAPFSASAVQRPSRNPPPSRTGVLRQDFGIKRGCVSDPPLLQGPCGPPDGPPRPPSRRPSASPAPDNRTTLAVAFFGSGLMALVAVQAPAPIPALPLAWAALYVFLRP